MIVKYIKSVEGCHSEVQLSSAGNVKCKLSTFIPLGVIENGMFEFPPSEWNNIQPDESVQLFYKHLKRGSNCRFSILVKCGAMTPYSEEQLQVQLDFVIQNNIRSVIAIGIWILLCPFCDFNDSQIGALASVFLSCM